MEEKGEGSRSKMESDIQHCSTDIQAARSDLQASARWRVIFSIVAQIFRLQDLTYRQVQDGEGYSAL